MQMVVDYFVKLKGTEPDLMQKLKASENSFSFDSDSNLKEAIEDANQMINKLLKTSTRIRKLKLTFTVNDERLINLIEATPEDYKPQYEDMCKMFDKNKMFLANLIYEFEELRKEDLDEASEQMSQKIYHYAGEYINYFKTGDSVEDMDPSMLEKFFVDTYLYRNDKYNDVLEFTSQYANVMLNKFTAYKTLTFLRFAENEMIGNLSKNVAKIEDQIIEFLQSSRMEKEMENIENKIQQTRFALDYIKSGLAGKSYVESQLNNNYLREKSVALLHQVRDLELRIEECNADIVIIFNWYDEYIEPLMAISQQFSGVKDYLKNSSTELSVKELEKVHNLMNDFNNSRWMIEHFLWSTRATQKGRFVDNFCDILSKDLKGYKKFKVQFLNVPVS